MVLFLEIDNKKIAFGKDETKKLLGIYKFNNEIYDNVNKLKEYCILELEELKLVDDKKIIQ